MNETILALTLTAAGIGFFHTLIGPDHYLPFVFMGRAGGWSRRKTLLITLVSGLGHLVGSVVLGAVGIAIGLAVTRMEGIEAVRGDLAAWALIAFGLVYAVWGVRRALRKRMPAGAWTGGEETKADGARSAKKSMTVWVLFTIFVLGPCEPLIPFLMVPAAQDSWMGVALVTAAFGIATLATMMTMVWVCSMGIGKVPLGTVERYRHALAGAALALCGIAIQTLGV